MINNKTVVRVGFGADLIEAFNLDDYQLKISKPVKKKDTRPIVKAVSFGKTQKQKKKTTTLF